RDLHSFPTRRSSFFPWAALVFRPPLCSCKAAPNGRAATGGFSAMSDVVSRGPGVSASSEDRVVAGIIYGLLFATPFFFGLTTLIAPVLAYVRRPRADPVYG